jgi:hypothetical protein
MMISDGNGIHADSIAIIRTIPKYPVLEIPQITNAPSVSINFAIIKDELP